MEGTDWLTAETNIQTQVKRRISKSRRDALCFTLCRLQHKVSSTQLQHPIPVYSDPAQRHYSVAEKLNSAKHTHIKYTNKDRRLGKCHNNGNELLLSTKHCPADKFKLSKLSTKWTEIGRASCRERV